ncbi:LeuA allosteric (dimerization) domain-containing protein, partial [Mycobacterium avium 11-0986]
MTIPERNRLPHPESATAWFGDRFGVPLPRGLRERAEAMSWDAFVATYGRSGGPLRLGPWERTDSDCAATGLGSRAGNYRAVIAVGDQIGTAT